MKSTVLGLFDDVSKAEQTRSEILALNISDAYVQVYDQAGVQLTGGTDTSARGFWKSFGETLGFGPSNPAFLYQEGIRRGGTVVYASVTESRTDEIADIMNRNGAVDIEMREAEWRRTGWTVEDAQPRSRQGEQAGYTPIVGEEAKVELCEIRCGGATIYVFRDKKAA